MYEILNKVNNPEDLKVLRRKELKQLASELRHFVIDNVSKTGGHLAPSLGVVELTIALHYVFDSPKDKIIWDVGHQSYVHKILTGRKKKFNTLRKYGGISGFPKLSESKHDAFGTGHSSTSISAALGIAKSRDLKKENHDVIAVIGDGALTGGMSFEALNHAGASKTDLLVILNDNRMSISPNVGALSRYLGRMVTKPIYKDIKKRTEDLLKLLPRPEKAIERANAIEDWIRALGAHGLFFKELGFKYFGPINGNNLDEVVLALKNIKDIKGPKLLHIHTKKVKGYVHAENDGTKFHGISEFNIENGEKINCADTITYTEAFSNAIVKLAENDSKIIALTAAMAPGTGLVEFSKRFPERFFDVGIAEQHAVTFAAGLALNGFKPVVAIYSTFLQRAYDQIVHDVALQKLPVIFALDRAGVVGDDGPTHHGSFDISYLRHIPNLVVMAPKDENELEAMLFSAVNMNKPVAIRYPRGCGQGVNKEYREIKNAEIIKKGKDVTVIAVGNLVYEALEAAQKSKRSVEVINPRFIKPLDEETLLNSIKKTKKIITIEDNVLKGGFGSSILELLEKHKINAKVHRIGLPDKFIEHGSQEILMKKYGLTKENVLREINKI